MDPKIALLILRGYRLIRYRGGSLEKHDVWLRIAPPERITHGSWLLYVPDPEGKGTAEWHAGGSGDEGDYEEMPWERLPMHMLMTLDPDHSFFKGVNHEP